MSFQFKHQKFQANAPQAFPAGVEFLAEMAQNSHNPAKSRP